MFEIMNNISDNTIGIRMAAFDYFVDQQIISRHISYVDGLNAKIVVRLPALIELWKALDSGEGVPESRVDAAVECVGKFNELQIASLPIPEFMKSSKKMQDRKCGESVKLALKTILKSQGRLV